MNRRFVLASVAAVILAVLAPAIATAQTAGEIGETVAGDVGRQLDLYCTRAVPFGFSATVLVQVRGEIVLHKGYGFADRAAQTPLSVAARFDIASVSKQFTATAILKLAQDGKLDVNASIGTVFADVPADKRDISILHLLRHESGISPWLRFVGVDTREREAMVAFVLSQPLAARPGERFAYNNVGYFLLAAIVEKVSGARFEDYCREAIFAPAGLRETSFCGDASLDDAPVAKGHEYAGNGQFRGIGAPHRRPFFWGHKGATGAITTARDLLRWHRALATDAVLNAESRARLVAANAHGYACGWIVDAAADAENPRVEHSGGAIGFQAFFTRWPATDTAVILLMNVADRTHFGIQRALTELAHGRDAAIFPALRAVDVDARKACEGEFALPGNIGTIRVTVDGDGLHLAPSTPAIGDALGLDARQAPEDTVVRARGTATANEFAWPGRWWNGVFTATFAGNTLTIRLPNGRELVAIRTGE